MQTILRACSYLGLVIIFAVLVKFFIALMGESVGGMVIVVTLVPGFLYIIFRLVEKGDPPHF
jgi:hypothetical protein